MDSQKKVRIKCAICSSRIYRQEDLITSAYRFRIAPFHSNCFAKFNRDRLWGSGSHIINGKSFFLLTVLTSIGAFLMLGGGLLVLIVNLVNPPYYGFRWEEQDFRPIYGGLVFLLPLYVTLRSWIKFERPLRE